MTGHSVRIALALLTVLSAVGLPSSADSRPKDGKPPVGAALPNVMLTAISGRPRRLTALGRQPCILFFFCGCVPCHQTAQLWSQIQQNGDLKQTGTPTVIVFLGDAGSARAFAVQTGLDFTRTLILTDPTDQTGQKFGVVDCPRVFVADAGHRLTYTNPDTGDAVPRLAPAALVSRTLSAWHRLPAAGVPRKAAR